MSRNSTVDAFRIAACLAAVLVHIPVGGEIGRVLQVIGRYCVIYFLLVGGYYLYRPSLCEMLSAVKRYLRSMLTISICCCTYFFVADTIVCMLRVQPPLQWLSAPKSLWDFLIFNRSEFLDAVMFYPLSVLYSCAVYYLLLRFEKLQNGYWLILPLIAANMIMSKMMVPWYCCSGWMFTAFPFMMLGTLLHEKSLCDHIPAALFILGGCALAIIEGVVFKFSYLCIGNVMLAVGVFTLAIKKPNLHWPKGLVDFSRWCTPVIFIIHCSTKDIVYALTGTPTGVAVYYIPFVIFVISGSLSILVQSGIRKKF